MHSESYYNAIKNKIGHILNKIKKHKIKFLKRLVLNFLTVMYIVNIENL